MQLQKLEWENDEIEVARSLLAKSCLSQSTRTTRASSMYSILLGRDSVAGHVAGQASVYFIEPTGGKVTAVTKARSV